MEISANFTISTDFSPHTDMQKTGAAENIDVINFKDVHFNAGWTRADKKMYISDHFTAQLQNKLLSIMSLTALWLAAHPSPPLHDVILRLPESRAAFFTSLTGCVFVFLFVVCLRVHVCSCVSMPPLVLLRPKQSVLWTQPRGVRARWKPRQSLCLSLRLLQNNH